jgi:putative ABC transport system ATP-binding protein
MADMLLVKNMTKVFEKGTVNETCVLDNLSLNLAAGDFVTIIGSNGAGKSTLFNALCGTITIDTGSVVLDGTDITKQRDYKRAQDIGRLFQDPQSGTAPDFTIEENLALVYAKVKKRFALEQAIRKDDRRFFEEQLLRLGMGLEKRLKVRVGLLSGGQRQALTLLLATLSPPKLLLLDEHTAALDPVSAQAVLALTREITEKHRITTLMITHNITDALSLGNRTLMMAQGKVVMDITQDERRHITVPDLLERYKKQVHHELTTDRIVLS